MNRKTVVLAAVAAIVLATGAYAQEFEPEGNFQWEQLGNGVVITGYTGNVTHLRIPPHIQGMPVIEIWEYAFYRSQLVSVTIPNSVTFIWRGAFLENQLSSITIPNSVRFIGDHAFRYNQLTSVVIGNSVTSIGYAAFWGNQLASITVPHSVTSIGDFAFGNATVTRQ